MKKNRKNILKDVIGMLNDLLDNQECEEVGMKALEGQSKNDTEEELSKDEADFLENAKDDIEKEHILFVNVSVFCNDGFTSRRMSGRMWAKVIQAAYEKYHK